MHIGTRESDVIGGRIKRRKESKITKKRKVKLF